MDTTNDNLTITQLIYEDVNKAYRTLITTQELSDEFLKLRNEYPFTSCVSVADIREADKQALLKMFVKS